MESAPPGDAIPPAPQRAASARKGARCGTGAGSTRPHRPRPGHTGRGTLAARYGGRARPGEGQRLTPGAPHNGGRHPPRGRPSATPTASNAGPQVLRCGAGAGSTARTDRARDTRVAEPWLHAPEDERPGEGQRLTPDAPRNTGRRPPRGCPSTAPAPSNAPTHQRTSHGTSAPRPLLLDTAT